MDAIETFLEQRSRDSLLRSLRPASLRQDGKICYNGKELFDFCSNDYLGLSSHPKLIEAATKAVEKFGTSSSASRLLSGDLEIFHELEEKTAVLKGKQSALVFNSGYQGNLGIISSLCDKADAVFADRLSHASILDGISLSGARLFRYAHNDLNHLESLLRKHSEKFKNCLIVTETIFSMDGDRPPLKEIVELKERYNCRLMVDEAHSTGIFGKDGSGVVGEEGLTEKTDLIMGTFSKALGSFGGFVAASKKIIELLINTSRSFIYSTALPPSVIAANLAALELLEAEPFRRERLLENAAYFRSELAERGFEIKSCSQIVPLIIGETERCIGVSNRLSESGYWVLPIRPPTVPAGRARLRFSLTYCHNREILQDLLGQLDEAVNI